MIYKLTHGLLDLKLLDFFTPGVAFTRGNSMKLQIRRTPRLDVRKSFFPHRNLRVWNSLPENVVTAPNIQTFKCRLQTSGYLPEL